MTEQQDKAFLLCSRTTHLMVKNEDKVSTMNNCELKNKEKGPKNSKKIFIRVPIKWVNIEIDTMKPPQFLMMTGKVNKQQS